MRTPDNPALQIRQIVLHIAVDILKASHTRDVQIIKATLSRVQTAKRMKQSQQAVKLQVPAESTRVFAFCMSQMGLKDKHQSLCMQWHVARLRARAWGVGIFSHTILLAT